MSSRESKFYMRTYYKWNGMAVCWDELEPKTKKFFAFLSKIFFWVGK